VTSKSRMEIKSRVYLIIPSQSHGNLRPSFAAEMP